MDLRILTFGFIPKFFSLFGDAGWSEFLTFCYTLQGCIPIELLIGQKAVRKTDACCHNIKILLLMALNVQTSSLTMSASLF